MTDDSGQRSPQDHAERREAALAAEAAGWDTRHIETAQSGDIPIIDVSALFDAAGQRHDQLPPESVASVSAELGVACREVGFFSLIGHQVPNELISRVFEWTRRFHALEASHKATLAMDRAGAPPGVGYLPLMHQKLPRRPVGNNNEAFIIKRDRDLSLSENLWPADVLLPGFRAGLEEYAQAMEYLARALLPLYAISLGVAPDFFAAGFNDPLYRLRLTHYPNNSPQSPVNSESLSGEDDRGSPRGFGIAPHVDTTFFTILAQDSPGLVVFSERRGCWLSVPVVPGALVVNTGELLKQWSNDEFLSVKHFANNAEATQSRYSVPFFFNATSDYPMACLPSCTGPGRPALYPTVSYAQSQGVVQGE